MKAVASQGVDVAVRAKAVFRRQQEQRQDQRIEAYKGVQTKLAALLYKE